MHIKSRNNPIKFLFILMILLSIMFIPTAFASGIDYNGTGAGTGSGTGIDPSKIPVGWSNQYLGYRIVAIRGSDGKEVSDVYDIWFGSGTASEVVNKTKKTDRLRESRYYLINRAGIKSAQIKDNDIATLFPDIPYPWIRFSSNAAALEGWVYSASPEEGLCNGLYIIKTLFPDVLDEYYESDEELYIVLEGITMFEMMDEYNNIVGYFAGSAYNWGSACAHLKMPYGNVWLRRGTNGIFGTSLMLRETWNETDQRFGTMTEPIRKTVGSTPSNTSEWLSGDELLHYGYDVHQYTFSSLIDTSTHTWDYPLDSTPGPAPQVEDAKRDKINIIKIYCTKDKGTGEVISWDGSFIRTMNPKTISIEDEPEYTVEDWRTLRMRMTSAPSTWSNIDRLPYAKKGSSSGVVTMDPKTPNNELTLAVLLVRYKEEEEEEIVLELQESEISRYYALSQVTAWKKGYNKGLWALPSLSTVSSCPEETSHHHDSEGHCHRTYCRSTTGHLKDTSLVFKVRNTEENAYKNILATQDDKFLV